MNIQLPELIKKIGETYQKKGILHFDELHNAVFNSFDDIAKFNQRFMPLAVNRKGQKRKGS